MVSATKPPLALYLAAPRGFCAGVDRAIKIVEQTLERYGRPVYVRHEIVHNRFVVDSLKKQGAVFVEELDEIPDDGRPVIFSAHGVAKVVPEKAAQRHMFFIDATCPLVSKVHKEAEYHYQQGHNIVLIGHAGHPEVIGTMGQLPDGAVSLIETIEDAHLWQPQTHAPVAFITQTTLSVGDTHDIISILRQRFPGLIEPPREDICYATTNRQQAVQAIARRCEALVVVGSPNSSNSRRLVEVALKTGCAMAHLVERAEDIPFDDYTAISTLGITAGASAPEVLVEKVIAAVQARFDVTTETVITARETISFKLPRILRPAAES